MGLNLISAPLIEPISLEVAKKHLLIEGTYDDVYIGSLIVAAREYCENYQNRAYITQAWELTLKDFPAEEIEIPLGKLQTVNFIKYKNSVGTETTLTNTTDYIYSNKNILGVIVPAFGKTWPSFVPYPLDAVIINFTCGYGDLEADVPYTAKQVMLMLIAHWYETRIPVSMTGNASEEIAYTVRALLQQDRINPV